MCKIVHIMKIYTISESKKKTKKYDNGFRKNLQNFKHIEISNMFSKNQEYVSM